jgi:uncharacterized protein YkwD
LGHVDERRQTSRDEVILSTPDPLSDWTRQRRRDRAKSAVIVVLLGGAGLWAYTERTSTAPSIRQIYVPEPAAPAVNDGIAARPWEPPEGEDIDTGGEPTRARRPPVSEDELLRRLNDLRDQWVNCGSYGDFGPSGPLVLDARLARAARRQATYLVDEDLFAHETPGSPDGVLPVERAMTAGYPRPVVGENIAWGQSTVREVMRKWADSPIHCATMLDPAYRRVGLGWRADPRSPTGWMWVLLVGG